MLTQTEAQVQLAIDQQLDGDQVAETGWDDMRFSASSAKKLAGVDREPEDVAYHGGVLLNFEHETTKIRGISFEAQLPHGYKLGTDLEFHIHVVLPVAGGGTATSEFVEFVLSYCWANLDGTFGTATTITKSVDVKDMSADTHLLWDFGSVLASNTSGTDGVSSMLICSLVRNSDAEVTVTPSTEDVYLLEADFHYQIDQERGSREEYTK